MDVINIQPGDLVVFKSSNNADVEASDRLHDFIQDVVGFEFPMIVLSENEDIGVIRKPGTVEEKTSNNDKEYYEAKDLWFMTEGGTIAKYDADMYLNPASPVVVDVDGYPIFYHPELNWQSIVKAQLVNGQLEVVEYQDERKFLGGKVKRKEIPLMETAASIEVIESEL